MTSVRLSVAAFVTLTTVVAPGRGQSIVPDPLFQDVYIAGEGGYHTYRIPSVIATPRGTLLAFAEGRKAGAADAGDIDLVARRSSDGGASWSPIRIIWDDGPNTVGNPCPVVDARTGTIWLLTTRNLGADREAAIVAGTSVGTRTVWAMKSDDDGATWTLPVDITPAVKRPAWGWYATGPGVGIQTTSGRLVIPANHSESGVHYSHLFFSEDGGKSWTLGASADAGTNESQVVELSRGTLMLNMRNHPPKPENFRMVATSDDGGRTLSKAVEDRALIEPPAQASLLHVTTTTNGDRSRLLFANPASTRRERLTVRLSEDDGRTWPFARVIAAGPAAYSSLVIVPNGSIGLLFEQGEKSPYDKITFARFTLEWLRAGK